MAHPDDLAALLRRARAHADYLRAFDSQPPPASVPLIDELVALVEQMTGAELPPEDGVDWLRFAFVTGYDQALHNSTLTGDQFYDEWVHAGCPGPPEEKTVDPAA